MNQPLFQGGIAIIYCSDAYLPNAKSDETFGPISADDEFVDICSVCSAAAKSTLSRLLWKKVVVPPSGSDTAASATAPNCNYLLCYGNSVKLDPAIIPPRGVITGGNSTIVEMRWDYSGYPCANLPSRNAQRRRFVRGIHLEPSTFVRERRSCVSSNSAKDLMHLRAL